MIGLQSLQGRAHSSDGRVHTHLNFEPGIGGGLSKHVACEQSTSHA